MMSCSSASPSALLPIGTTAIKSAGSAVRLFSKRPYCTVLRPNGKILAEGEGKAAVSWSGIDRIGDRYGVARAGGTHAGLSAALGAVRGGAVGAQARALVISELGADVDDYWLYGSERPVTGDRPGDRLADENHGKGCDQPHLGVRFRTLFHSLEFASYGPSSPNAPERRCGPVPHVLPIERSDLDRFQAHFQPARKL